MPFNSQLTGKWVKSISKWYLNPQGHLCSTSSQNQSKKSNGKTLEKQSGLPLTSSKPKSEATKNKMKFHRSSTPEEALRLLLCKCMINWLMLWTASILPKKMALLLVLDSRIGIWHSCSINTKENLKWVSKCLLKPWRLRERNFSKRLNRRRDLFSRVGGLDTT